jgi:hypothetical protein
MQHISMPGCRAPYRPAGKFGDVLTGGTMLPEEALIEDGHAGGKIVLDVAGT